MPQAFDMADKVSTVFLGQNSVLIQMTVCRSQLSQSPLRCRAYASYLTRDSSLVRQASIIYALTWPGALQGGCMDVGAESKIKLRDPAALDPLES